MLESLDSVDWSRLKHAYGSAADVPATIRALASRIASVRSKAMYELYGNIFHQGTRYDATASAVPFLYELVKSPDVADKHEIIALLVHLAIGYDENWLPLGLDPDASRRECREFEASLTDEERAENERYGLRAMVPVECYDAVLAGVDVLVQLIAADDLEVRKAAAYALAWFPEKAIASVPRLRVLVENAVELGERATGILSLGILRRQAPGCVNKEFLARYGEAGNPLVVRQAAAIALADEPLEPWVSEVLLELMRLSEDELEGAAGIPFNEGRFQGLAAQLLSKYGRSDRERIVTGLCDALRFVNAYESMEVVSALLEVTANREGVPWSDIKFEDLDETQRQAFSAIAEHGGWSNRGGLGNFDLMMHNFGLPASQAAMYRFLGREAEAKACEEKLGVAVSRKRPWWKFW